MGTTQNSISDFKERMDRISEMIKRGTPDYAEAARSLASALGTALTVEGMIVSQIAPTTTLSYEELLTPTRHIINLAQEHAQESTMTTLGAIDNLVSVAMSRGVDFITQRKSYREVIAANRALEFNESINCRGDELWEDTQ